MNFGTGTLTLYKVVDILAQVHFKSGFILYRRNNRSTGDLGTHAKASFHFFHLFRAAHF